MHSALKVPRLDLVREVVDVSGLEILGHEPHLVRRITVFIFILLESQRVLLRLAGSGSPDQESCTWTIGCNSKSVIHESPSDGRDLFPIYHLLCPLYIF